MENNEPIIINDIDVSKCPMLKKSMYLDDHSYEYEYVYKCKGDAHISYMISDSGTLEYFNCKASPDCIYKQLQRKTAEYNELKERTAHRYDDLMYADCLAKYNKLLEQVKYPEVKISTFEHDNKKIVQAVLRRTDVEETMYTQVEFDPYVSIKEFYGQLERDLITKLGYNYLKQGLDYHKRKEKTNGKHG